MVTVFLNGKEEKPENDRKAKRNHLYRVSWGRERLQMVPKSSIISEFKDTPLKRAFANPQWTASVLGKVEILFSSAEATSLKIWSQGREVASCALLCEWNCDGLKVSVLRIGLRQEGLQPRGEQVADLE